MTTRPLKLGLALLGRNSVPQMVEEAKRAEAAGFDVVLLPDHLGFTAPLVPLVAIAAMGDEAHPAERVAFVKDKAGDRFEDIELQFGFFQVSLDDPGDLSIIRMLEPDAPEAEIRQLTTVLDGSVTAGAERIQRLHDGLGISYFTFNKTPATSWETFEELVAALR